MKTTLNQTLIFTKLSVEQKPILKNGKLAFEPNPSKTPYILFDEHQDAPIGFGVKVAGKLTYVVQRKINGKVIKTKIGNVSDYPTLDAARSAARKAVETMKTTGRNPNSIKKEIAAAEITLGQAFADYRLKSLGWEPHQKYGTVDVPAPSKTIAKPNSIAAFDKAVRKLEDWKNTRIRDLDADTVVQKFKEIASQYVTTAEQTFRWANRAVVVAIEREEAEANRLKREPTLTYNPFVAVRKLYRSKPQLEEAYIQKGVRSPMSDQETLGKFLDALWQRRKGNRTGGDYLLCSILWGTRKTEPSQLAWWDRITKEEAKITSHVDLDRRIVFFYDTKNRYNHTLPICDAAYEILKQRHESRSEFNKWVFPARSKYSKTGQYSDSRSLIKYICNDAGIPFVANHNFRRTFASMAEELVSMSTLKYLLNHQDKSNVTNLYIKKDYERVKESLQRIELHLLTTSPTIYNAVLTPKYPHQIPTKYPPPRSQTLSQLQSTIFNPMVNLNGDQNSA